jgi:uncharacterized protein with PQ loop repeat
VFKQYWKDLKQTWKPATLMYIIAVVINLITGWSMDSIVVGIFGVIFISILLWAGYGYLKRKLNKN